MRLNDQDNNVRPYPCLEKTDKRCRCRIGANSPHLSPSMLLKSLTMAMPSPASEYSTVRMVTSHRSSPNSAWVSERQLFVS